MQSKTQAVAELAHELWVARGRPHDAADTDWLEAERRVTAAESGLRSSQEPAVDESLEESFPASDPPATHQPDVPPKNAPDKWRAAARTKPDDPPSEGGEDESSAGAEVAGRL